MSGSLSELQMIHSWALRWRFGKFAKERWFVASIPVQHLTCLRLNLLRNINPKNTQQTLYRTVRKACRKPSESFLRPTEHHSVSTKQFCAKSTTDHESGELRKTIRRSANVAKAKMHMSKKSLANAVPRPSSGTTLSKDVGVERVDLNLCKNKSRCRRQDK